MSDVTRILSQIEEGDPHAAEKLLPLVYDELRKLAAVKMSKESPGQTLDATGLVNEVFIRLVDVQKVQRWDSRGHFFAAAAEAMRRILVEIARRKARAAHGGGRQRVELLDVHPATTDAPDEVLAIDEAIDRLAAEDPLAAQLVKLRYFAGLSVEEASQHSGISSATGYRHWTYARAWIRSEVLGQPDRQES